MFDFGAVPPEINSTWMYAGPGAGPMLAAAVGWEGLAVDMYSAADSYRAVVAGLTGGAWLGPSALAMAAAAGQYAGWLMASAAQAEQTAGQARAAAVAFESALAMTVPPVEVALNRVQLSVLVATNFFGQNTAAIAATEAQYAVMWVQDAVAMYGYAGACAAATALTPFAPPPVTTKMAALADQASAVAAAVAAELQERMSTVEQALHAYLAATDFPAAHGAAAVLQGVWGQISGMLSKAQDTMSGAAQTTLSGLAGGTGLAQSLAGGLGKFAAGSTGAAGPSAQLGQAVSVGRLSVPPSWSSTMGLTTSTESAVGVLPDLRAGVSALPDSGIAAEPAAMWGGSPAAQGRITSQPARRVTVIPRMPCAG